VNKGAWLTVKDVAVRLATTPRTLSVWREGGKGPSYFRIGGAVRYREDELEAWIEAQRGK